MGRKKYYGYAPCPGCGMSLSFNGGAYTAHYKKHIREGVMVWSVSDGYRVIAAEHRVQLTGGNLPDLQAESTPQPDTGLKADSVPPASS